MKIRHNFIPYIIPVIFALWAFTGFGGFMVWREAAVIGLIVLALVAINYFTVSLEFDDSKITGATGVIKKKKLYAPLSKIHYCEMTTVLCFNKIEINVVTGTYIFTNMASAEQFVAEVNGHIN